MRLALWTAALALTALPALAAPEIRTYSVEADFGDIAFGLESAILDRGLVIDHVSHVGEMLNRTAEDVGAETQIYTQGNVYLFCSATLSREMMAADIENLGHCPYGVFLYEAADDPGTIVIGHRVYPEGPMKQVEALLTAIAREAAGRY